MTARHTVLLAGGPRLFQSAFARVLDGEEDFTVVAVIDDTQSAEAACARLRPSVAMVDGVHGAARAIRVCTAIKSRGTATRVLFTCEAEDAELLISGVEAGIDGFASREDTLGELLGAARVVARGEARIPPRLLGLLLRGLIERRREEEMVVERLSVLTNREREVVSLMAAGMNRDAIARELVISRETARTHVQRVLTKLGVHSQLEAAAMVAASPAALRFRTNGARS